MVTNLAGEDVEIAYVVANLRVAELARHPRGTNTWCFLVAALRQRIQVVAVQRLGRDDQPRAIIDRREVPDKSRGKLAKAVADEPELARKAVHRPKGGVSSRPW